MPERQDGLYTIVQTENGFQPKTVGQTTTAFDLVRIRPSSERLMIYILDLYPQAVRLERLLSLRGKGVI